MDYKAMSENAVTIYKNAFVHNNNTTLFYAIKPFNYNMYTTDSISSQINSLYNMITSIEDIFGSLRFSLVKYTEILSPEAYKEHVIETIRMWDQNFTPSQEFLQHIQYTTQNYCLLALNIDEESKSIEFENKSAKEIFKDIKNKMVDALANYKQQNIDKERIDSLIERINNIGQGLIKPCSEEMVMSFYIKKVFPSYNLVFKSNEVDNNKLILSFVQQEFKPFLNYFEMSNSGVEVFGAKGKTTYGCVIDVIKFPEEINSESFSLDVNGIVVNAKTLTKEKARLKFTRTRSNIEYEQDTAAVAGSSDQISELEEYRDMTELALAAVNAGRVIAETDIHILVLAKTVEELNKKRQRLISSLKDMGVIATFAPDQAKEYLDSFVWMRPRTYKYLMELRYPLSFRLSQGAAAGDFDSKFASPIFGEDVSKAEATSGA